MLIVIDSREQAPFGFTHERYETQTREGTLTVGDYSLAGLEDKIASVPGAVHLCRKQGSGGVRHMGLSAPVS